MSCQQVPTAPAFNPYPRSVQVGEFEVAIGGGIWVAIGAQIKSTGLYMQPPFACSPEKLTTWDRASGKSKRAQ